MKERCASRLNRYRNKLRFIGGAIYERSASTALPFEHQSFGIAMTFVIDWHIRGIVNYEQCLSRHHLYRFTGAIRGWTFLHTERIRFHAPAGYHDCHVWSETHFHLVYIIPDIGS